MISSLALSDTVSEMTHGMGQDTGQVGEIALVDGKETLRADGLVQAIEDALVQVASLVIHARHDGVGRMHDAADNKSGGRATGQVQSRAFLHAQMSREAALREEVGWQLDRATESGSHHRSTNASVQTAHALRGIDLAQPVE